MSETTTIAITPTKTALIAVEIAPNSTVTEEKKSGLELIGAEESLSERLGSLNDLIKRTAEALIDSVASIADAACPQKVEAEFSISLTGEAGFWYIAKGSATGAIKVKLVWSEIKKPNGVS